MVKLDPKYEFKKLNEGRASGILLHISSLPGPYGIGTLGKSARNFADFLSEAGQKYWQVLPIGPTGFGDSPYQSFSSFAGNPYLIDLDYLVEDGLIERNFIIENTSIVSKTRVDYGILYIERNLILREAFKNFDIEDKNFLDFVDGNDFWLRDYSVFMALKDLYKGKKWSSWPDEYKLRDQNALERLLISHKKEIDYYNFVQYKFFSQWKDLKDYVNKKGIKIIGDLPIYVAEDSSDLWSNPQLFLLKDDLSLKYVGGCPPDGFSDDGQLWGNPVYNWDIMKKDRYSWWISRIRWNLRVFDTIRLDHFRGFESYWQVPGGDTTAKRGKWIQGPGWDLFKNVIEDLNNPSIIAEDLGYMTKEVYDFREKTGFPSMKVLQFAFDPNASSDYLPHNYVPNSVVYTGTHDNDTILGWIKNARKEELDLAKKYFNITEEETFTWGLVRGALTSVAKLSIFQMQDFLFLGNEARMNNPGTLGNNWTWRMENEEQYSEIALKLREFTRISGRL